jgi:exosome complex component MTR3
MLSVQSPEEREMSAVMQTALEAAVRFESFPKSVLDVFCTILEAGGSELAAAITAASAAIADAGVEMNDLVTACEVVSVEV